MANAIYPKFKELCLGTLAIDLVNNVVNVYLIDLADYTYGAAHSVITDVPAAAREEVIALGTKTITDGTFDTANFTWTAAAGDQSEAVIITVTISATEYLIAYYDTGVTGLPVTPNSGDIDGTVNVSGWFDL